MRSVPATAPPGAGHATAHAPTLRARRLGVFAQDEAIVLMRTDCFVCRSEGLAPRSQVLVTSGGREIMATLYQVAGDLLGHGEIGLSEAAWSLLGTHDGEELRVGHPPPIASLSAVRQRVYGHRLDEPALHAIIRDIVAGRYTEAHLAAFVTACSALPLDPAETAALTRAMVAVGDRLAWPATPVVDKHSVGGLPGNRTTPIVVAIVAALGLTMPKTSSRAITSPAGTADTMETLAPVALDIAVIRQVVEQENGCIVWGGAVRLSPADDIIIRVERVLDLDTEGQLVASVLSKKIAAGSTHLVIDMPIGPTAKVRTPEAAAALSAQLTRVAGLFGLTTRILPSDGSQPIGRGIGPALEARDVLAVLQGSSAAPADLRARACVLAGALLEMAGHAAIGSGEALAGQALADGRAWAKFQRICEAQGGMRVPPSSVQRQPLTASRTGRLVAVDNRKLARVAKLAGAPDAKAAGVEMHVRLGDIVERGQPLCTVHAESRGELDYALALAAADGSIFAMEAE